MSARLIFSRSYRQLTVKVDILTCDLMGGCGQVGPYIAIDPISRVESALGLFSAPGGCENK
jgi:hypothetical protein